MFIAISRFFDSLLQTSCRQHLAALSCGSRLRDYIPWSCDSHKICIFMFPRISGEQNNSSNGAVPDPLLWRGGATRLGLGLATFQIYSPLSSSRRGLWGFTYAICFWHVAKPCTHFYQFHHLLSLACPVNFLSCINDCIEDMAILQHWQIYSTDNAKVAELGKIFVISYTVRYRITTYTVHVCCVPLLVNSPCFPCSKTTGITRYVAAGVVTVRHTDAHTQNDP